MGYTITLDAPSTENSPPMKPYALESPQPQIPLPGEALFLTLPCYDAVAPQSLASLALASRVRKWHRMVYPGSLLEYGFNRGFVDFMNTRAEHGWTDWAMHHADIEAPMDWADVLIEEREKKRADLISAVVAIKDDRLLTTTGFRRPDMSIRRLTVKECKRLPETFDIFDVRALIGADAKDAHLVVNTGLWVMRYSPALEEFPGFDGTHLTRKHPDGIWRAHVLSEDWAFSGWCYQQSLRVVATRKLRLGHHGRKCWWNDQDGGCDVDPGNDL